MAQNYYDAVELIEKQTVSSQSHNLKVIGSNPIPATTFTEISDKPRTAVPLGAVFCVFGSDASASIRAISPVSSISRPPVAFKTGALMVDLGDEGGAEFPDEVGLHQLRPEGVEDLVLDDLAVDAAFADAGTLPCDHGTRYGQG